MDGRTARVWLAAAGFAGALVATVAVGLAVGIPGRSLSYTEAAVNPSATAAPFAVTAPERRPPAPPLAFTAADGRAMSLEDFRGRTVLVNLWATWCPPCIAEMPDLDALQRQMGGEGFEVVTISLDRGGSAAAKAWLERNGLAALPAHAADPAKFPGAVLPTSILLDGQGRVAWTGAGARAWTSAPVMAEIARVAAGG